jgi:ubiquinone/menaquinone biosynthesis C-methylase UbiE
MSAKMQRSSPFDVEADQYDSWFESCEGKEIFEIEKTCLRTLLQACKGRWVEVGVGSGRFAAAFGISQGLDPSSAMPVIATRRGILAVRGVGEDLPYRDSTFDGVLMVTTLCFVEDAERTLSECHRVLRDRGVLVVGIVPVESAWGQLYVAKGREGHSFYSKAKFYTCEQVVRMCAEAGFGLKKAMSCLQTYPGEEPMPSLKEGIDESAGFVAIRFYKT